MKPACIVDPSHKLKLEARLYEPIGVNELCHIIARYVVDGDGVVVVAVSGLRIGDFLAEDYVEKDCPGSDSSESLCQITYHTIIV